MYRYIVREEPTGSFGLRKGELLSGMMGQLQREEADFCTSAGPTTDRNELLNVLWWNYRPDPMKIASLKPSLLPHSTALIRPFSGVQ